jgi:hypothetical protein
MDVRIYYWPEWEGPVATAFGGVEISWLVGFVVAGGLYYLSNRSSASTSGLTGIDATPPPREDELQSEGTSAP